MDAPKFALVFERAEQLDVPIYIHPGVPPEEVIRSYYSNIGGVQGNNMALACYGWGWHSESAIHVLRLLIAGIFDSYPKLKIIIGHMALIIVLEVLTKGSAGKRLPGSTLSSFLKSSPRALNFAFGQRIFDTFPAATSID